MSGCARAQWTISTPRSFLQLGEVTFPEVPPEAEIIWSVVGFLFHASSDASVKVGQCDDNDDCNSMRGEIQVSCVIVCIMCFFIGW